MEFSDDLKFVPSFLGQKKIIKTSVEKIYLI